MKTQKIINKNLRNQRNLREKKSSRVLTAKQIRKQVTVIEAVTTPDCIHLSFPIVDLSGMFSALYFSINTKIISKDNANA